MGGHVAWHSQPVASVSAMNQSIDLMGGKNASRNLAVESHAGFSAVCQKLPLTYAMPTLQKLVDNAQTMNVKALDSA